MPGDPVTEDGLAVDDVAPPGKSRRNTVQYSRHADDADTDDDDDDDDLAADDENSVESANDDNDDDDV